MCVSANHSHIAALPPNRKAHITCARYNIHFPHIILSISFQFPLSLPLFRSLVRSFSFAHSHIFAGMQSVSQPVIHSFAHSLTHSLADSFAECLDRQLYTYPHSLARQASQTVASASRAALSLSHTHTHRCTQLSAKMMMMMRVRRMRSECHKRVPRMHFTNYACTRMEMRLT